MNQVLKSVLKKLLILFGGIFLLLFAAYSAIWVSVSSFYQDQIDLLWDQLQQDGHYSLTGTKPQVSGFPSVPTAIYSGKLISPEGLEIEIPHVKVSGFPTPNQVQHIEADQGFILSAPFLERVVTADNAKIFLRLPMNPPLSAKIEDIERWQKLDDPFRVEYLSLATQDILIEGGGKIGLDEKLQIKGFLNLRVDGLPAFLDRIERENPSSKKQLDVARSLVQIMSQTDPKTGKVYFVTTARLENQGIFLGPLKIFPLPTMTWGRPIEVQPRLKPE